MVFNCTQNKLKGSFTMKKFAAILLSFLMMTNLAIFTSFAQSADVEITSLETLPEKQWGYLEGVAVSAPEAVATNTNIADLSLNPVWEGIDGFNFGDKPEGNELVAYTATYTAPDGYVFADALAAATENTTLSADKKVLTYKFYTYVIPSDAIYIDDNGTNSTDDYGEGNLARPYATIDHAMGLLEAKGGGVIVIVDKITETTTGRDAGKRLSKDGHYTIMGWDKDSMLETTGHYNLCGNTTFRDLNINMTLQSGGIYARGYSLTMGDKNYSDLVVTQPTTSCTQLFMTSDGNLSGTSSYVYPGKLTINSGEWSSVCTSGYGLTAIDGDIEYEINGGSIATLTVGFHCGSSAGIHTMNGDITVNINGGKISTLYLGSFWTRYMHNGNCDATINGGTVGNVFFRSAQADSTINNVDLPIQNGDYTLTINSGTITGKITDTSSGTTGITGSTTVDILNYDGDKDALVKKITTNQFDTVKSTVIYVDYENGDDTNTGLSKDAPIKTMTAAFKKFANNISGKIIICGEYASANGFADTKGRGEVTITGWDENSSFLFGTTINMYGSTIFEDLKINVVKAWQTLIMGGNKLVMGDGIEMVTDSRSSGSFQITGGTDGAHTLPMPSVDITINSGTYGTISAVGTLYGKSVSGDVNFTINGGTFNGAVVMGSYCSQNSMAVPLSDDNSGMIGGNVNMTINGGTFSGELKLGGKQYGTVGAVKAKINGGKLTGNILIGPELASYNKDTQDGITFKDGNEYSYTTDILGDAILEITGGTVFGKISHTGNTVRGKSAVIMTNDTSTSVTDTNFDYIIKAGKNGTVSYDSANDIFEIVPKNSALAIFINGTEMTKTANNLYTLFGGENNVYNIEFGGETFISESFSVTPPIAELTPVSEIIFSGGKNTNNPLVSCTASNVTWEPADSRFKHDTQYTATVVLTAKDGIEYADDLSGLNINGGYSGNTVNCTLSEDKTEITVKITFPKTAKKDLEIIAETPTKATVTFKTKRNGEDTSKFHNTTVTLTNVSDNNIVYSGIAEENGINGSFTVEDVVSGFYNITVKKQGYIIASLESVLIASDSEQLVDAGELIPGDIIDGNGNIIGDGRVDIDDFIIALRAISQDAAEEVSDAANISESEINNVSQLGFIKSYFKKNADDDASEYDGYFENTYYKLTVDKKLTVGYIGGSIIQGASVQGTQTFNEGKPVAAGNEKFIDRMHSFFEENFPDAEIHSINAGVSDTGSNFAIFRLEEDLMLRDEGYIPDLVFLEFCVNDFNTFGQEHMELVYESLINNVYKINPNADIVCMLTAMRNYDAQKDAHINVATHYNIPIVDVGAALRKDYDIAGDCKVFTNDDLHPNGAGYEYYTKLCRNLLEKYIINAAPENPVYKAKELPAPLYDGLILNPKKIEMSDSAIVTSEGSSWVTDQSNVISRIFNKDTKKLTRIASSTAGDSFTFEFTGDAFGFIIKQSPSMGSFEYSVDGGEWKEFRSSKTYVHNQTYIMETNLDNKKHTVTVRVTGTGIGTQAGCEVGIAGILYNDLSE